MFSDMMNGAGRGRCRSFSDPFIYGRRGNVEVRPAESRRNISSSGEECSYSLSIEPLPKSFLMLRVRYAAVAARASVEEIANLDRLFEIMPRMLEKNNFDGLKDRELEDLYLGGCALIYHWRKNEGNDLIQFVLVLFEDLCDELDDRCGAGRKNADMIRLLASITADLSKIKTILKYRIPERLERIFNEAKNKVAFKKIRMAQEISIILPKVIEAGKFFNLECGDYLSLVHNAVSLYRHVSLSGKALENLFEFSLSLLEVLYDDLDKILKEPSADLLFSTYMHQAHTFIYKALRT